MLLFLKQRGQIVTSEREIKEEKYKIWKMSHVEPRVAGSQEKQSWRVTRYKAQQGAFLCLLGTLQEIVKMGGFLSSMEIYSGKEAA